MTATELERAQALAGVSAPVHWHEVTGSTNALAAELAEAGAPQWTLVGAGHQTAGRGRLGRTWVDQPGGALMTSLVLRPALAPAALGLLTLLAGSAWAETVRDVTGLDVRCKWPNDLLVGDAKAGGVLAASSVAAHEVRWVVIGSGLNLEAPDVAGSTGLGDPDPVELLGGFLSRVRQALAAPPESLAVEVIARWSAVSATLGRPVAAIGVDGVRLEGLAIAIDAFGRLIVETADGPVAVTSEEVEHLR